MSSLRRRTLSCALCRKRKVKCDLSFVPCAPCLRVGASCSGGDIDTSGSSKTRPRSLLLWLQDEVSKLEEQPNINQAEGMGFQESESHGCDATLAALLAKDFCFTHVGSRGNVPLPSFVLRSATRLPSVIDTANQAQMLPRRDLASNSAIATIDPLRTIPRRVADFLLEAYISRAMQAYPIFHEPWLRSCYVSVMSAYTAGTTLKQQASPRELFTVSLVMAIALSTAARAKQQQASAMALRLFLHASKHLPETLTNDLAGLQAILLIEVYALMNPAAANVFFLCGYSMQMCIELGLHQEESSGSHHGKSDLRARDLKRRIMWTAWEIDASCSNSLARPLTLYPSDISTPYPSEHPDAAIQAHHVDHSATKSRFICAQIRQFRIIEVEVIRKLYIDGSFSATQDFATWATGVEHRIHAWRDEIQRAALANTNLSLAAPWDEMVIFSEIADPLVIATLFRPSTRGPRPSVHDLLKAFDASIQIAKGYQKQAAMAFGSPKYTFHPCHHVFSAAMLFLHTIREHASDVAAFYSEEIMKEYMSIFSEFFSQIAERWPAAQQCRDEYERLLSPLKERYFSTAQTLRALREGQPCPESHPELTYLDNSPYGSFVFPDFLMDPVIDTTVDYSVTEIAHNVAEWERYFNFDS